jgi:hypothetical protein
MVIPRTPQLVGACSREYGFKHTSLDVERWIEASNERG